MLKIIAADNLVPLAEHLCDTQLDTAGWRSQWQSPSTIFTPSRVVEQWLQQRIAGRYGVCTAVNFAPISAIWPPLLRALGSEAQALSEESMSWRLAELLRLPPWSRHPAIVGLLGPAPQAAALLALSRRLAGLYANYQLHRPGLCQHWLSAPADHWQAQLWQALVTQVQREDPQAASLALRWPDLAAGRVNFDAAAAQLGSQIILFGLSQLTPQYFAWLASARQIDVVLYLLTPGADVPWNVALEASSSFVRAWGRVALSNQNVLESPVLWGRDIEVLSYAAADNQGQGALAQLQQLFRSAGEAHSVAVPDPDTSLHIHTVATTVQAAQLLLTEVRHLVQTQRASLDSIAVYCPALAEYAPALLAASDQSSPLGLWPLVIEDTMRESDGPEQALDRWLTLVVGRIDPVAMHELLMHKDLADWYGYDVAAMQTAVAALVEQAPVRWGLHAAHKTRWLGAEHPASEMGTWVWALQRAVAGQILAQSAAPTTLGVLPLALDSDTLDALLPLDTLLTDLSQLWAQPAQTLENWAQTLQAIWCSTSMAARPDQDMSLTCARLVQALLRHGQLYTGPLALKEFVELCHEELHELSGQTSRSHSGLSIRPWTASSVVPARYTFILGFDPEQVPRRTPQSSMDLIYDPALMPPDPLWQTWGVFTPRDVDLALLMQTVLASETRLCVISRLVSPVDAVALNLPAPLANMLDWLDAGDGPESVQARYVTEHPDWTIPLAPAILHRAAAPEARDVDTSVAKANLLDWRDFSRFVAHPLRWFLAHQARLGDDEWQSQTTEDSELAFSAREQGSLARTMLEQRLARPSSDEVELFGAAWLAQGTSREGNLGLGDLAQMDVGLRSLAQWAQTGRSVTLGPTRQVQIDGRRWQLVFDAMNVVILFAEPGLPLAMRQATATRTLAARHDRVLPWALLHVVVSTTLEPCDLHCRARDDELRVPAWSVPTGLAWLGHWLNLYRRSVTDMPMFLPLASQAAAKALLAGESSAAALEAARETLDPAAYQGSTDLNDGRVARYIQSQGEDPLAAFDAATFLATAVNLWTPWLEHVDRAEVAADA